jgi:hypothetical protein
MNNVGVVTISLQLDLRGDLFLHFILFNVEFANFLDSH